VIKHILLLPAAILTLLLNNLPSVAQINRTHDLMPVPQQLTVNNNRLDITQQFKVAITGSSNPRIYAEARRFIRRLGEKTGLFLDKQGFVTAKDNDPSSAILVIINHPANLDLYENENYLNTRSIISA
jgi:hexosaminidase